MKSKRIVLIDMSNFFTIIAGGIWSSAREHYHLKGIRDAILNQIIFHMKEFNTANVVLAYDAPRKNLWRKDVLPSYKFKRDEDKEVKAGQFDRREAFKLFFNPIVEELRQSFPCMNILIDRCEADDVIGTIVNLCYASGNTDVLISSKDSDFDQLVINRTGENNTHVVRVGLHNFKLVPGEPKVSSIVEMIVKGATKDSVPNAYEPDNFLVEQAENKGTMKQKSVTKKVLAAIDGDPEKAKLEFKYYERNEKLIDLAHTPDEFKLQIKQEYIKEHKHMHEKLANVNSYFESVKANPMVLATFDRVKHLYGN